MRVVIQRVRNASVTIDGAVHGTCGNGFMLLDGFQDSDTDAVIQKMAVKISKLRIFEDDAGKMNRSILDTGGSILSISQFTLYADCAKGNRPSFAGAGNPDHARSCYQKFNEALRELGIHVEEGIFGADMKVSLLNDGPVTIVLDSEELFGGKH